jgi:recombinational DNA repair protein RecT
MGQALQLTNAALSAPSTLKEVFEIEAFKSNCVANYEKTTGQKNGEMVYERERILFMRAIQDNQKLEQCSRFSIYSAFVELFVSGLTLNDGLTYIIPYKDTAQFQIGWKGRLEQMSQMPEVNYVPEPQVVLTNELPDFDYELGETPRVVKHKPAKDRTISKDNRIEFVYLVLDTKFGKRTFLMTRQEVLTIRDTYSVPYKYYISKGGKWPDGRPMDPPFWITNEAEAFKKTLVKRAYKYLPKTPRMKALDEKIKNYVDHEDGTSETTEDIDYGLADVQAPAHAERKEDSPANTEAKVDSSPGADNKAPRTRRTKEQIAKDEAAAKVKTMQPETVTGPGGTKADAETAEVIQEAKISNNPVDGLPDLGALMNM